MAQANENEARALAWLSYLGILLIIPLLVYRDSAYAKFHVKQGLVLLIAEIIWSVAAQFFGWIPFAGQIILAAGWLLLTVLTIIGIVNAASGKEEPLPVIGKFAASFTF